MNLNIVLNEMVSVIVNFASQITEKYKSLSRDNSRLSITDPGEWGFKVLKQKGGKLVEV